MRGLIVGIVIAMPGLCMADGLDVDPDQVRDLRDRLYRSDRLQQDLPPDLGKEGIEVFEPGFPEEANAEDWPEGLTNEESEEQEEPGRQRSSPDHGRSITIDSTQARTAFWVILGVLAVVIGFFALRNQLNRSGKSPTLGDDEEVSLPAEAEERRADLEDRSSGDTVHGLLLRGIGLLETHGRFQSRPGLTAREILADAKVEGEGREAFAALVRGVEATRFARRPADQALLEACQGAFAKLHLGLADVAHES